MAHAKSAIPKVRRVVLKAILWTFGIVTALILVVVAINAFDEDLSPEAEQLLKAPPNPWSAEQNLYIALMGFDALPGEFPIAVGQRRVAAYDRESEALSKNPLAVATTARQDGDSSLKFVGKVDFCEPLSGSCWTGIESHSDEIDGLLRVNQVLYQRFLDLRRSTGYYETATPSIYMRFAYVPGEIRRLFLANIALRVKTADSTQQRVAALGDLYSDVGTWRKMLVGEGVLVSKMVAIASLHGDFALLADLIADPSADTETIGHEIEAILDQVNENDWKLRGVFAHEFRVSASFLEPLQNNKVYSWLQPSGNAAEQRQWWEPYSAQIQGHFFKIGATENLGARTMLELQRVADSDAGNFLAAREAYHRWIKDTFDYGLKYAYNPIGRSMVAIAADPYTDFLMRAHDVEAFVRLVRLSYEVRQRKLRAEDVDAFMKAHPQWAIHPVDSHLFMWDASKRNMAMQPLAPPRFDRRFSIPIWTADTAH